MTKAGAAVDPNNEVKLFKPITIKNITVKNRIFLAPMCMFSAGHDGKPNSMHFVHYGTLAQRGVGLIVIEATAVQDIGRITPYDLGLWNDEQTEYFKPMVNFMHYHGAVVGVQLAHAGRKASDSSPFLRRKGMSSNEEHGWPDKIVGPSAIALNEDFVKPIELSKEQIKKLVEDFGEAARRANEAGIDVIEIHAAHGYLIHQFLSPISNHRTDEYGGSFENRIRFCLEIIESVKSKWPKEKPIFVRFSATDYIENGWNVEETSKICSIIKKMGIDLVDCSSGAISPEQKLPPLVPGYQVPFAKEVKKNNPDLLVSAVGLILDGPQAEEILQNGSADVITIGRPCLRDTSTVLNWAKQLNVDVQWPTQYRVSKLSSSKKF
ncbi:putative oxidoreductase [Anaeromyces robustus]|uniref:Putative oxidoreductase n=1 Tax=Anaeromyces robustus TaxID=1754192 RepID=A0A1Y1XRB2_9FUNG|nr:putative oxidoreductase [Anaeromyces robustus]ORX88195.1 putative oxidoreductase [Anaeromyces robustus]|eukprot:ORX63243.1 putative oxidoreductase [Anaeromyces robustus]